MISIVVVFPCLSSRQQTLLTQLPEDFDPALYGMPAEYDENGNYKYQKASIQKPTNGLKASKSSAKSGKLSMQQLTTCGKPHKVFAAKQAELAAASAEADGVAEEEAPAEEAEATNYSSAPANEGTLQLMISSQLFVNSCSSENN